MLERSNVSSSGYSLLSVFGQLSRDDVPFHRLLIVVEVI